jgi:hypothetical protein
VFLIWLAFVVPSEHRRTRWWTVAFLIPLFGVAAFWVYAFTLEQRDPSTTAAELL